ncbi:MAG: DUF4271 domain-containing protein [Flavobacteriales bacterium]|jgi:hypothetical protein
MGKLTPIPRQELLLAEDWMFFVFLICILLITWSRLSEPGQLRRMVNSAFNIRLMRQEMREETQHRITRIIYLTVFSLMSGMCIYAAVRITAPNMTLVIHPVLFFLGLSASVGLIYLGKSFVVRLVSHVAAGDFSLSEYLYSLLHLNQVSGILLLPVMLVVVYSSQKTASAALTGAAAILGLMLLYRWSRGVTSALSNGVPLFYIFFYLCTLEILPLLVIAKAIR